MTKPPSAPARAGISPNFNALDIAEDVAEDRNVKTAIPSNASSRQVVWPRQCRHVRQILE